MEMTSPEASRPMYKRRCSLMMPYPALYGSWRATLATPARSSSSSINPQRRWSTVQMDAEPSQMINAEIDREAAQQPGGTSLVDKIDVCVMDAVDAEHQQAEDVMMMDLIMCDFQRLPLKDFGCEVRPALDVALFIKDSVLLIDVEAPSSSAGLVDLLLPAMLHTPDLVQEAKMILFTNDTGTVFQSHFHTIEFNLQFNYIIQFVILNIVHSVKLYNCILTYSVQLAWNLAMSFDERCSRG